MASPGGSAGATERADGAAVNAMRLLIQYRAMNGIVVIGEGERRRADALQRGAGR